MGKGDRMKVTVITATGDRPLCLDLLSRWMENQTLKPDQWIVVDDGNEIYIPNQWCDYIYRKRKENEPECTLNLNLMRALQNVQGDVILFCEDDEYYAPDYIKTMTERIKGFSAVGICKSKYYHLPMRTYFVHPNKDHASLAQTGIMTGVLKNQVHILDGNPFIDVRLWRELKSQGCLFDDGQENCLYVGMKGMPGRKGVGWGHKGIGRIDPNLAMLKKWIRREKDFKAYAELKLNWKSRRTAHG